MAEEQDKDVCDAYAPDMQAKRLSAELMNPGYATKEEVDDLRGALAETVAVIKGAADKLAAMKFINVAIAGAPFDLTVSVPDMSFDEVLARIAKFYDVMILKCKYQEAINDETDGMYQ